MKLSTDSKFQTYYERHCKHLKLKGLQPKTIEAYSRAIRRIGAYFSEIPGIFHLCRCPKIR